MVRSELRLLHQRAEHDPEPLAGVHLTVVGDAASGYELFDGPDQLATAATPRAVLDLAYERVHRRVFELASLRGWVRFHGAVIDIDGARVALVGPSGVGKTTLALSLLVGGGGVETDESFVTRAGEVLAVARRFHVKPGWREIMSGADWLDDAPVLAGDPPLRLVDPTEHGLGWHVPIGPIDRLVVVERGEGPSLVEPLPTSDAVQVLIDQSFPLSESRGSIVRAAAMLADSCATHRLVNGADTDGERLLRILARPAQPR